MKAMRIAATAALLSVSTSAFAGPNWEVQPIQSGQETVRFYKGVPTVGLELNNGVVQVTPLPFDHGSLVFAVAVYNDSFGPANFGVENVAVTFSDAPVRIFTKNELVRKAKNRAMWSQIGLALLTGVAAGAAASQQDYYSSTWITPRGTYRSWFSTPSVAGQLQATAIVAAGGVGIATIQNQLDRTVVALGTEVLQLTTIDPGESYAGQAVVAKFSPGKLPARVNLTVNWNGEAYPFIFQIAKEGTLAPPFPALTRKSDLIDFRTSQATTARGTTSTSQVAPQAMPAVVRQVQQPAVSTPARALNERGHVWCVTCR